VPKLPEMGCLSQSLLMRFWLEVDEVSSFAPFALLMTLLTPWGGLEGCFLSTERT
jgi:hypothetical protein